MSVHFVGKKKKTVRPYLQDLPADDRLTSCQICGTFMRSCQPRDPAVWPPPPHLLCHPCCTQGLMEQPPTAARRALGVVWGYHMTYFGAACQPVCLTGTCKHCRTHPLRWVPANLGCGQSHLGQQPVSVCMHVPVSSSNWVNGLQYVKGAVTIGVEKCAGDWQM